MRRRYAFEAEEISEEVKAQLEKVEDVVEDKCDDEEACNKMIEKIEDQEEKFNEALSDMASAAKDCKDGECSKSDMASAIAPKMAELKEVAKSIGVATEEETLSEDELKDAKDYLEGAKEIVEAKLDELSGDDSGDDEDDDDDEDEKEDEEATEAFLDMAEVAMESAYLDIAMEGVNVSAVSAVKKSLAQIRATRKVMKSAAKGNRMDEAADAARECESYADDLIAALNGLDSSVGSAVLANIGFAIAGILIGAAVGTVSGRVMARGAGGEWARSKAITKNVDELSKQGWGSKATIMSDPLAQTVYNESGQAAKDQFVKQKRTAGRGIGVVLGAGNTAGTAAMIALAKKRGAISSDGEPIPSKFSANDANALITALKVDARRLKAKYAKLAAKYSRGDASAEESFFGDNFFESALEGQTMEMNKILLGDKTRQARKLIRSAKSLSKTDVSAAIASLKEAKAMLEEQKGSLQKLSTNGPINYMTSTIKKIDRKIASLRNGNDDSSAEESFDSFIDACESYTIPTYERRASPRAPFLFN